MKSESMKFFEGGSQGQLLVLSVMENCGNGKEQLLHKVIVPMLRLMTDIAFCIKIIQDLDLFNTVVLYAGNNHTALVNKFMQKLEFKLVDYQGVLTVAEESVSVEAVLNNPIDFVKMVDVFKENSLPSDLPMLKVCVWYGNTLLKMSERGAICFCSEACQGKLRLKDVVAARGNLRGV